MTVNWGDSTANSTFSATAQGNLNLNHDFAKASTYTIGVTVTNAVGLSASANDVVTTIVPSVAPTVTAVLAAQTFNKGVSSTVNLGSFSDAGTEDGPWTVTVNWGDSTANTTFTATAQGALSQAHTYASAGTYSILVTVANSAGKQASATSSATVIVPTVTPTVTAASRAQTFSTGVAASVNLGSFSDAGTEDGPWTVTVNWGDSTANTTFTATAQGNVSQTHTFASAGTYSIDVTVTNSAGTSASANTSVTVIVPSVTPTVTAASASQTFNKGVSASVNLGSFSDMGTNDGPWTITVNWGDSTANSTFSATTQGPLSQAHTYASAGPYTVDVTVANSAGKSASANTSVTVIMPSGTPTSTASFVGADTITQGNWIGVYGTDGYTVAGSTSSYPAYAQVSVSGESNYTWASTTSNIRALQQPTNASAHIAATWYSATSFTININLSDGKQHSVGLYALDWGGGESEEIEVLDAATHTVLNSQTINDFTNGEYLVWNLSGDVKLLVTNLSPSPDNALVSGLFFAPPVPLGTVLPNVTPTVTASSAAQTFNKGVSANVNLGSFSDAGKNDGPWTVTVNWGDSTAISTFTTTAQGSLSQPHTYASAGTYSISVTVTNSDGNSASANSSVSVDMPLTPTVTSPLAVQTFSTGVAASVNLGSFSDAGTADGPWTVTVNWGDSTVISIFTVTSQGALSHAHTYASAGTYSIGVAVTNSAGNSASVNSSVTVIIPSVTPTVTTGPAAQTITAGVSTSIILGSFTDAGTNDGPWPVTVNWGDSTTTTFTTAAQGPLSEAHTYASGGTYSITFSVANSAGKSASANSSVTVITPIVTPTSTATFVGEDTTTQGNWVGVYGSEGYTIAGNASSYPAFAQVSVSGETNYTWAASTSDVRALQTASNPSSRIAATWYSSTSFTIGINFSDGQHHLVALYALDWGGGESEMIDVIDAPTGTVLNSVSINSFANGEYLEWNLSGNVQLRVTNESGANALVSGLFFDAPGTGAISSFTPTVTAAMAGQTLNTGVAEGVNLGSFSDAGTGDGPWTVAVNWGDSTANSTFTATTQGSLSQTHLYENAGTYSIVVTVTNSVGKSTSASCSVTVITPNGTPTATASFVTVDTTAQGNWSDVSGGDGYDIVGDNLNLPAYATVSSYGEQNYTWASTTSDVRALQMASNPSDRVAATWYCSTSFTIDINISDGQQHLVALYALDWGGGESETIDVIDAGTGTVLNSQSINSFKSGEYLLWNLSGDVQLRVTNLSGSNALASGLFFGLPSPVIISAPAWHPTVSEGVSSTFGLGTFIDYTGNNGPWNVTVNWGDSTPTSTFAATPQSPLVQVHSYANAGTYSIGVTVTNAAGVIGSNDFPVTVVSSTTTPITLPVLSPPMGNQVLNEGIAANISLGTLSDPGTNDGPWNVSVNWGDNPTNSTLSTTAIGDLSLAHAYASAGTYFFVVTVTNAVGGAVSVESYVTVVTPGPVVTASPGNETVNPAASANINLGSFSDAGINDGPWNVTVNWGDSTANSTFQVTTLAGLNQAHAFAANGTYTVAVTVTNALGEIASASGSVKVVTPLAATDDTAPSIVTSYDNIPNFGANPTVYSVNSGNWSSPSTWSTGVVPTTGAVVSIEPNTTVTYDTVSTVAITTVIIQNGGQLVFLTNVNTTLTVVNLLVLQGGTLQIGTQANPVTAGVKAQIVFPNIPINTTTDPSQYGNGLIALGTVTMYGSPINQTWVPLAVLPLAGATTLTLSQPVTGWNAGDTIILPDSSEAGGACDWELLTIASISANGTVLTLTTQLQFNHPGGSDGNGVLDFLPDVGDLTRNVVVKSASPGGTRGYTLFTDRANVNIQYVQFGGLGRTTSALGNSTTYDAAGNVTSIGTNQLGRYPITFDNLFGPSTTPADGYQFTFVGNSVSCPLDGMNFRWAIAIEGSNYGLVQDNVVYNWYGAGIITVDGSESYNVIAQNFVVRIGGTGERPINSFDMANGVQDLGVEGAGFWFAGPNNIITGNVAADVETGGWAYGFLYYIDVNGDEPVPVPNFKGADTSVAGQYTLVNMEDLPLLGFTGNQVYGVAGGMTVWYLGIGGATVGQSLIESFTVWNVWNGFFAYPMVNVVFDHYVVLGYEPGLSNPNVDSTAFVLVDYLTIDCIFENCDIQDMEWGIQVPMNVGQSSSLGATLMPFVIENSYLRNYYNIYANTESGGSADPTQLCASATIIRNVQFAQVNITDSNNDPQYNIALVGQDPSTPNTNWTVLNQFFVYNYNQVAGDDFQVYYTQQQANVIVPQTTYDIVGAPVAGLTNQQAWTAFGVAIAGAVAPSSATTQTLILGLVVPI